NRSRSSPGEDALHSIARRRGGAALRDGRFCLFFASDLHSPPVPVRSCVVSFQDHQGIRHAVDVEAESLYEAAVHGVCRLSADPWLERIGPATVLDVEVREPATKHSISLQHVERWLGSTNASPAEASRKAKLKMMLVQR